jgi:hypothetical protein
MDIDTIISKVRESWDNLEELAKLKLEIVSSAEQTARDLGAMIALLSQTFISEKENGFEMTVTEAEHRGKAATGGMHETYRARLVIFTQLYEIVRDREHYLLTSSKNTRPA